MQALQEQVKTQQEALATINAGTAPLPAAENPSAPANPEPTPLFPTTDESVVAAAPPAAAPPPAAEAFPTTDASVTTTAPGETISTSGAGASLVAPMTIVPACSTQA